MSSTQRIEANRARKRKKSKEKIAKLKAGTLGAEKPKAEKAKAVPKRKPEAMRLLRHPVTAEQSAYMRMRKAENKARSKRNKNENQAAKTIKASTSEPFSRQVMWGMRVFDFWFHRIGVVIELDGEDHKARYDEYRDRYNFCRSAIAVFRVKNGDMDRLEAVCRDISSMCTWQERSAVVGRGRVSSRLVRDRKEAAHVWAEVREYLDPRRTDKTNTIWRREMIFLFNADGSLSLAGNRDAELATIQPADMALVVDVLLVAIERAKDMQGHFFMPQKTDEPSPKPATQESQIERVLKEWRTLEDLDPTLKITSDPRYVEMAKNLLQSDPKFATTLPLGVYLLNSDDHGRKPNDLRMNVGDMVELAKGVGAIKRAEELVWLAELRKRHSGIDANGLALALHQAGVYGSIKIQHGATLCSNSSSSS